MMQVSSSTRLQHLLWQYGGENLHDARSCLGHDISTLNIVRCGDHVDVGDDSPLRWRPTNGTSHHTLFLASISPDWIMRAHGCHHHGSESLKK
jgi:hypothetical protein